MPESDTSLTRRRPAVLRSIVLVGGVIALLLLGGANGLLLARFQSDSVTPSEGSTPVAIGFSQDMTVRDRQVQEMAGWTRDHSADPAVRLLAHDVESAAALQVGTMQAGSACGVLRSSPPAGR